MSAPPPQTSVTKPPFKVHSSQKKSSRWEPSYSNHGPPALPPQKRKEKKFRQLNCYYKLWIIIFGSFFAPSLCHLLPKPDVPLQELGMGRKEQGGPDIWNVSYPACTPSFLGPGLLLPMTASSGAVLKGCHGVMSNRPCLGRLPSCLLFPHQSHCQESHSLLGMCKILCLLTLRPSSGVKPQPGLGERFIFLHWNALRWTALPPVE